MITYKNKKIILGIMIALFMAFSVCFFHSTSLFAKASAEYALEMETELASEYDLNTEIVVPSATFVSGGEEYAATENYLIFPDGSAKKGTTFKLETAGKYQLVYSATINGKFVKEVKEIMVKDALFLTGGSAVTYGTDNPLVNPPTRKEYVQGEIPSYKVDLAEGDTLKITKPVNLNELGDSPVFKFFPYNCSNYLTGWSATSNYKILQNQFYYIRLVDVYNSENYLTIRFGYQSDGGGLHICAYGAGQDVTGLEKKDKEGSATPPNKYVQIDGQWYYVRYNAGVYGCPLYYLSRIPEGNGFGIFYDDATKEVKVSAASKQYFQADVVMDEYLVTDLDNPALYETKKSFKGFTTGEVTVEIWAGSYRPGSEVASFEISELGGQTVPEQNVYIDTEGPQIDIEGYDGGIVKYAVNEEFTIPQASYTDTNGVASTSVIAYSNYYSQYPTEVGIFDGKFTPKREGLYVIAYKATDRYGAESVKLMQLQCGKYENNEVVKFNVEKVSGLNAGAEYTLNAPTITSPNGGEYYKAYLVSVASGNKTEIIDDRVVPMEIGAHKIVYEYGDKYLQETYSYDVEVAASNNVVFSKIQLPNYFISGKYYTLDPVYATTFAGASAETTLAEVYVKNDGGAYGATPIDLLDFKVEAKTDITFKFVKNGISFETPAYKVVEVFDAENNLKIENYFVGDFTKAASSSGISFTANATEGDSALEFANVVSLKRFSLSLSIPSEKANYSAVKISLIDYYNRDYALELGVLKYNSVSQLLCDGFAGPMLKPFEGSSFKIMMNLAENKIMETEGLNISFDNKFSSDKIIVKITLEGITGEAAVSIEALNDQPITSVAMDNIAPIIDWDNPQRGYADLGSTVTVVKANAFDDLSPFYRKNLTVTVTDPSRKIVTSEDGIPLLNVVADRDYTIKLTQLGRYQVAYSYADQSVVASGVNITQVTDSFNVLDNVNPELTLEDGFEGKTATAKHDSTVTVKKYTATDNATEESKLKVRIVVFAPNRESIYLKGTEKSFKATLKGLYTVRYICADEQGNYDYAEYYVNVK